MKTPFINDVFSTIWSAFENLYPDKKGEHMNNEWRLCSEELPETNDEVLTTYIVNGNTKERFVEAASYWDDGDGEGHWSSVWDEYRTLGTKTEVIAWMPMPKPYRG